MKPDPKSEAVFEVVRSPKNDPQQGDEIYENGVVSRRVVARDGKRIGYVNGPGMGSVQWCSLFGWQLWCDGIATDCP